MSLLKEIVSEAVSKDADVSRLLRLCLVLASRLKHEPLKAWVRNELEGYPVDAVLPPYRVFQGVSRGYFIGLVFQGELEIPLGVLPESLREHYAKSEVRDSIAACADLINGRSKGGSLRRPWPIGIAVKYGSKAATDGQCTSAWIEISMAQMVALVDQVKTKVVSFALEIEEAEPSAGEILGTSGVPRLEQELVTQIFNTTINGGNLQNVAVGSAGATQAIVNGVHPGDLSSLLKAVRDIGLPETEVQALDAAITQDREDGEQGMGGRVKSWLAELALRAGQKVAEKGVDSLVTLAAQALSAYFALSA